MNSKDIVEILEWENIPKLVQHLTEKINEIEDYEVRIALKKLSKRLYKDAYILRALLTVMRYVIKKELVVKERVIKREVVKENIVEREIKVTSEANRIVERENIKHSRELWYEWKLMRVYNEFIFSVRYGLPRTKQEILLYSFTSVLNQIADRLKILTTEEKNIIIKEAKKYMQTGSNRILSYLNDHVREIIARIRRGV